MTSTQENIENKGWIKLYRKILEHPIFTSGDSYLIHLTIHLLLKVNHEDKRILFNGQEIVIKRGQGVFGLNQLVKELTPYKNEKSKNFKKFKTIIYRRLKILEKLQFLKLQPTNKFTIITILNYDVYQASETPVKLQRNSSETPVKTNKNDKNDKNEKNIYILEREYTSINYLIKIPQEDLYEFYSIYQASKEDIIRKAEQLYNYCQAHGKRYKNYKAFLRNALERDFKRRPQRLTIEKTGVSLKEIFEARQREKGGGQNG